MPTPGAVPADRGQGRLNELFAPGAAVFVPSRVAAVAGLRHISLGAILFQVRAGRRLVLRRRSHRLGFHVTDGTAYSEYRPVHPDLGGPQWLTRKAAIVGGNRIPFARSNSAYAQASNQDMLTATLDGLVARFGLQGKQLGEVVAGAVLKHSRDFNLTRESVLGSKLSATTPAYDVQQACGTGLEAAILVANKIALGQIESGIAGGVDTTSDAPLAVGDDLRRVLISLNNAKTLQQRLKALGEDPPRPARARRSRATPSRAPAWRWATTPRSPPRSGRSAARSRTSSPSARTTTWPPPTTAASSTTW